MEVKLSSKGQLVLPKSIRDYLDLSSGDSLKVDIDSNHRIVLTKVKATQSGATIERDPDTGLPVLVPKNGKELTTEVVKELLTDFP